MTEQQQREAVIIGRILDGEKELFHELIRPYEHSVYLTALSLLRNPADAEDAAQETMLKAYRSLKSFRSEAKFGTWITAIALNESRNRLERAGRSKEDSLDKESDKFDGDYTPALLRDWRPVPLEALEQKELASRLKDAIASLPLPYRQVFTLRDLDNLEVDDVAELLQVSANVVRVRLYRARMMLQKQLVPVLKEYAAPARRRWSWR